MKEFGGYLELDQYHGKEYYPHFISLNCGRNCLAFLIESRKIEKVYLPYFLCDSVKHICQKYGVMSEHYHIDAAFKPVFKKILKESEFLYVVNYYGQLNDDYLKHLKARYSNLILDYTQACFQKPIENIDTIFTCRKYFGLADGAYLSTDCMPVREYPVDVSYDRMSFILGRYEHPASEFYEEYVKNNDYFNSQPIKYTSRLTKNLLKGIDYDFVKKRREENFDYLHYRLGGKNQLSIKRPEGPFSYPFLTENGYTIRKYLQDRNIYVAMLWPEVREICNEKMTEYRLASDILPLPIDQRYDQNDMRIIADTVLELVSIYN